MTRRKRLILITTAVVGSLILSIVPIANQESPAQAANVNWTKYTGDVTLDTELYVLDAWVLREDGTYRMWYTHGETDLTISTLRDELGGLNLDDIIDDLANTDLEELLDDLAALDANAVMNFLDATSTVIGYATSTNGIDWLIQDSEVLAGGSDGLWSSVGLPSVIKDDSTYEMWYTHGKTDLTESGLQDILDDLDGNAAARKTAILDLLDSFETVIGYATWDGVTSNYDWTVVNGDVFHGDGNLFDSVFDPCVIKDDSTYKMWYTQVTTDLDQDDLGDILSATGDFDADDMVGLLDGTTTVIGYATSNNGTTWTVQDDEVLGGNPGGLWESVADPSVIKNSATDYDMWYTNVTTDLDQASLQDVLGEIRDLDIPGFLDDLAAGDLDDLIDELNELNVTDLKALLSDTSTRIGYATWDGDPADYDWTVQQADDLTGDSDNIWSSVGAPTVVKLNSSYKMWYTQGIDSLTVGNLLDILQGTNLSLGYAYYSPAGDGGGGGGGAEDYADMDPGDAADELGDMDADDAADILGEMDADDAADILGEMDAADAADIVGEMDADDAADILGEMDSGDAADVLEEMGSGDAADVLEEMDVVDAVNTMEEIETDSLEDIIPNMSEQTLTDTLPGLTPDKLYDIDPQVLFDSVPNAPTEQLLGEDPPTPPAGAGPPIAVYTTPSGARYLAIRTWGGEWVVVMRTPPPIEQLMIKTKEALENVETIVEIFEDYPPGVKERLPSEQVAFAYFTITFENATPEDIEMGHIKFRVDQEWLEDNSIHKWAVFLYRYDPEPKQWIALPTKRVDEDSSYVYYTSPVPQFSTFAISGSEDIPEVNFNVSNLAINPTDANIGQDITITADITNLTNSAETYVATLWIDNTMEAAQDVSINANQTKAVLFTVTRDVEGSFEVRLDRLFESFNIIEVEKAPAAFTTSNLIITPAEVNAGDEVTISLLVANTGDLSGTYQVTFKIDAVVVGTKQVTLDGGASETVTFTTTRDVAGTYSVTIDGLTGTFEVLEVAVPPPEVIRWWRIAIIITAVTLAIVIPLYIRRRRMMA